MCRFVINRRTQPAAQGPPPDNLESSPSLLEALQSLDNDADIMSANIESEGELDDEFLQLLQGMPAHAKAEPSAEEPLMLSASAPLETMAMCQPPVYPGMQGLLAMPLPPAPHMFPTQQPIAPPPYALQMMQQAYMQQQQQTVAAPAPAPRTYKRNKTEEEAAEQEEIVKRRRRESAQRSRQRKAIYMTSLECENKALKMENERLRSQLASVMSHAMTGQAAGGTPSGLTKSSTMRMDVQTSRTSLDHMPAGLAMGEPYMFTMPVATGSLM